MASCLFQNCRSKKCVVCVSRIDLILFKIDSIVKNRLDCDKNRLDCDSIVTRLSAQLTCSKKPTGSCATFCSIFTDSTLFESIKSILQQSSRFAHANHSHLALNHTHWTCAIMQSASRMIFKLICFTPHLGQSPVALKTGRQKQERQTRSRTMKTMTGTRHALLTALLCPLFGGFTAAYTIFHHTFCLRRHTCFLYTLSCCCSHLIIFCSVYCLCWTLSWLVSHATVQKMSAHQFSPLQSLRAVGSKKKKRKKNLSSQIPIRDEGWCALHTIM